MDSINYLVFTESVLPGIKVDTEPSDSKLNNNYWNLIRLDNQALHELTVSSN